ncbi:MAG: HD domain-containing protein [Candidatus Sericytochromatia bacterium]|nr:HD domain-containing protein [Candidatus Tanganyikabacteria bacterium]
MSQSTAGASLPRVGDRIADYVVRVSQLRQIKKREGDGCFYIFKATNAIGQLGAVVWNDAIDFKNGDYLRIAGDVKAYKDGSQVVVARWEVLPREDYEPQSFVPRCPRPLGEMIEELDQVVAAVEDPWIRRLLSEMLLGDGYVARAHQNAPAAKFHHQPYLHGLLEHNLLVVKRALGLAGDLPVNRSIVVAGALLHDIGKIEEYAYDGDSIEFTEVGNLIGHIALGYFMTRKAIERIPDFPSDLATQVLHIVLSHQGRLDFGSPVEPRTAEAFIVHHADAIDAYLFQVARAGAESPDTRLGWSKSLNRFVLGNPKAVDTAPYDYHRA